MNKNEFEQLRMRQSSPQQTEAQAIEEAIMESKNQPQMPQMEVIKQQKVTVTTIREARSRLEKYKEGKSNLESQVIENERWYRKRHWEVMKGDSKEEIQPSSAWLFNCIANKHADAMDNFPAPNILPREKNDEPEAQILSAIIPVILEQDNFEDTYSNVKDDNIQSGTGIYGVFWDKSKCFGKGDIAIKCIDILNLFWEPGVTDIQRSKDVFHIELVDNDLLEEQYPQLVNKLSTSTFEINKYVYDDNVDTTNKSAVVDWYYKKMQNGKIVLHYCKFVNDEILYATENETEPFLDEEGNVVKDAMAETGLYDHGKYPFVIDALYKRKGTIAGFGYIDIGKNAQEYIDRGNQAILKNMLVNAVPRYFAEKEAGFDVADFANLKKEIIEVDRINENKIYPIQGRTLSSVYVQILNNKIEELKETTGNRDVSNGGTNGVTAASAIAAMQEAGSKLSRDNNKTSYRAYKNVILLVIELIRQFYDLPRYFRIVGENGMMQYEEYSNAGIKPQYQGNEFGVDGGYRIPLFDIEISAEKQSPYSKLAQNELALQFYQSGFFNPQLTDQALACLDMMDFDRKEFVVQKIQQNGTMYQQLMMMQQEMLMLAQIVDEEKGSNISQQIMARMAGMGGSVPVSNVGQADSKEALGGSKSENKTTKKARERVAESTSPT